jgi:hypothetical protein
MSEHFKQELKEIDNLFIKNPEMLAFGKDLEKKGIKVVYDNPLIIKKYKGPVGIRYYIEMNMGLDEFVKAKTYHAEENNDTDEFF